MYLLEEVIEELTIHTIEPRISNSDNSFPQIHSSKRVSHSLK